MSVRNVPLGARLALAAVLCVPVLAQGQVQTVAHGEIACSLFTPEDVSAAFSEPMEVRLRNELGCRWNRPGTPSGFFLPIAIVELRPRESFAAQNPQGGVRLDVSNIGESALVWTIGNQYYGWTLTKAGTLLVQSDRLDVMMTLLELGAERLASVDPPTGTAPAPTVTRTPAPSVTETVVTDGGAASATAVAEAARGTSQPSPAQPPSTFELPPPLRPEDFPRDAPDDAPFKPVDPCKLFTAAEIGAALGAPVGDGGPGFLPNMCAWDTRGGNGTVVVQTFAREYYEDGSRSEGGEALAGVGERAFVDPWLGGYRAGALLATGAVGVISPKRDVSVALLRRAVERMR